MRHIKIGHKIELKIGDTNLWDTKMFYIFVGN